MMSRRGNNNKLNGNSKTNVCGFDKDNMISKEDCAALTTEKSMPSKEKASILSIPRDKHKHKTPFTRKVSKSEIEVLLHQCLTFEEDTIAEDDTPSEHSVE